MMTKPFSEYLWWEFCVVAKCSPDSPDIALSVIHKKFYKHPQRHELSAAWLVERASVVAKVELPFDLVTAASKYQEQMLNESKPRTIGFIKF